MDRVVACCINAVQCTLSTYVFPPKRSITAIISCLELLSSQCSIAQYSTVQCTTLGTVQKIAVQMVKYNEYSIISTLQPT